MALYICNMSVIKDYPQEEHNPHVNINVHVNDTQNVEVETDNLVVKKKKEIVLERWKKSVHFDIYNPP